MKTRLGQGDDHTAAVDRLAEMVAAALQESDALQLWDVSIGLDRARLAVEKLRSENVLRVASADSVPPEVSRAPTG